MRLKVLAAILFVGAWLLAGAAAPFDALAESQEDTEAQPQPAYGAAPHEAPGTAKPPVSPEQRHTLMLEKLAEVREKIDRARTFDSAPPKADATLEALETLVKAMEEHMASMPPAMGMMHGAGPHGGKSCPQMQGKPCSTADGKPCPCPCPNCPMKGKPARETPAQGEAAAE